MADFLTSTHRDRWIFTVQDLVEKASAANARAVQALQQHGATRVEIQPDGSLAYPGSENGAPSKLPEPLKIEEELFIRRYYEHKIQQVCGAFSFPNKIQATAVLYFKRFYLSWSVMEHDPKHIMLTCIYISCKVEEFHVSAEELGKGIQQDHQVILKNELTLLQGLNFDLIVYAPYRSLDGFVLDIQKWADAAKDENVSQKILDLQSEAIRKVDAMLLTDCPLLFPPGQLALAALRSANVQERAIDMEKYLRGVCERQQQKHSYSELVGMLNQIAALVDAARTPIEEEVRRIDRKLKFCRNPGLQDESKKRDRKGKHKSKRTPQQETISPMVMGDTARA
ncbi:cyclin-H1-1 isoform X1 [Selaginella moellendorffii]|uniref:cyclin-H1-1 isoform X1 n=1 Tax=Selaginella moellendorffii TaxID=88036 RepID=UPI000D1CD17C|nr:cyclin-H1-1 isoform X1 [Selaginella moellendorffii]|eukprot:XP_024544833.1 cyclin-H1-1 isoform X1 [Selaginella moellendorffii]